MVCLLIAIIVGIIVDANGMMFKYRTYQEMIRTIKSLNESYPELADVFIAQEKYDLPYPPELQCEEDDIGIVPCKQYVIRITNKTNVQADRPEVFFSGALHGDERIGPQTTMELALLLVKYANSYANGLISNVDTKTLESMKWIWRLVNTRDIYIMPMTNAHGYFHNKRQELGIDPNRDYNYRMNGDCMQAMTSRVVNEIWRDHMFQLAITFHGGMRCVTYEWGSPNHMLEDGIRSERSPDDLSQVMLGSALSQFAGAFADGSYYPTGTMNDVVYGVFGGMEDWAYAASWENHFADSPIFTPCTPSQYGGYPAAKTTYNNMTHRAFNILVETSDSKHPHESSLGYLSDIYNGNLQELATGSLGHVSQNVRMGLLLIDMVQPYLIWHNSKEHKWSPLPERCQSSPERKIVDCDINEEGICLISKGATHAKIVWEVLGSFTVDATFLQVSSSPNFPPAHTHATTFQNGWTQRRYYIDRKSPPKSQLNGPHFMECIPIQSEDKLHIRAVAKVDQNWATHDHPVAPTVPPQSHLVNARTNDNYIMEWNGKRIQGTSYFYSKATSIVTSSDILDQQATKGRTSTTEPLVPLSFVLVATLSLAVVVLLSVWYTIRRRRRCYKRTPTAEPNEEASQSEETGHSIQGKDTNSSI